MKILILEPADVVRELIVHLVAELGHEAVLPEAAAGLPKVDAVVLEPVWPAGSALATELRDRDERLPIICASIGGQTAATRALRPVAFLVKPFSIDELAAALAAADSARPPR